MIFEIAKEDGSLEVFNDFEVFNDKGEYDYLTLQDIIDLYDESGYLKKLIELAKIKLYG